MKLVGSRLLGLNSKMSDYDYAELVDSEGEDYKSIVNDHFERNKHCYRIPKGYMQKVSHFQVEDPDDIYWIFLAADYRAGLITDSPFIHRKEWIEKLKNLNLHHPYIYNAEHDMYRKRCYHVMYNLECLLQDTLYPSMERVRAVYSHEYTQAEFEEIAKEMQSLLK